MEYWNGIQFVFAEQEVKIINCPKGDFTHKHLNS